MTRTRVPMILCAVLGTSLLHAADFASYRGFQFGMTLSDAAKQAGLKPAEARTIHQRPALIQELDWQPRSLQQADPAQADPVMDGVLSFYNGDLFRIVITYNRYKVEGMTAGDVIEGLSRTYGPATRPTAQIVYHSVYGETAPVLARWEDDQYRDSLIQTPDGNSFALILYSKRLDALAQAAIAESVRLDAQEAPERELARQTKLKEEESLELEKARAVNTPNFRP
jgi:hypothetical protein